VNTSSDYPLHILAVIIHVYVHQCAYGYIHVSIILKL
jgi:hypothetical protein